MLELEVLRVDNSVLIKTKVNDFVLMFLLFSSPFSLISAMKSAARIINTEAMRMMQSPMEVRAWRRRSGSDSPSHLEGRPVSWRERDDDIEFLGM